MNNASTILIVDDLSLRRDTLESLLYGQGYTLIFAENGEKALKKAAATTPDLILLDVMMPEMDGFEVCRRLRADPLLSEVPIIMVTALDSLESRLQGIEAGADDFISKPFNSMELRARVKTITRLNRYRRLLRSEEQVHEQAALLDIAQDAILTFDLNHKILFWNKSAESIYGWTKEEALGQDADTLLSKEPASLFLQALALTKEVGFWTGELVQRKKGGKEIIIESRWTCVQDQTGNPKSIFIVNTDITQRKLLEAQFLRAQRLENIGALASGIAHDLNNVLTPILISLQIFQKKLTDPNSQKMLTLLESSTQHGTELIKQILSFGRGFGDKHILLQPKHLLLEMEKIIKATFPKSINISIDFKKDLNTISADATQLQQVLMNLCVNARDAMPQGGHLTLAIENFVVDKTYTQMNTEAKVGDYVVISVADTGMGIPPECLEQIFEPFFTTKEVGKGTGLGLSTTVNIIKNHNGFIQVTSKVNEGTQFKLFLPATKSEKTLAEFSAHTEIPVGNGELILLIDDEASLREITKVTLESYNYQVITASNGIEGVELYAYHKNAISIVLTNMMMPIMDGIVTIQVLQKINPEVKIIVVSGLREHEKITQAANLGVNAFLTKPYTAQTLLHTLHKICHS